MSDDRGFFGCGRNGVGSDCSWGSRYSLLGWRGKVRGLHVLVDEHNVGKECIFHHPYI